MNTELFLAIADMIEAEPSHWNLSDFLNVDWDNTSWVEHENLTTEQFYTRCDTTACVAGWATILSSEPDAVIGSTNFYAVGMTALGLTQPQAERLFYASGKSIWAEVADEYGWDLDTLVEDEDWSIIQAPQAADVLRRIAQGELTL